MEAIDRGLETSGVFVVVLTPAAVASKWVRTETNAAVALEHQDLIRFLPLDVVECDIPLLWSGYQYVLFRSSYEIGLDALFNWLDTTSGVDEHVEWLKTLPNKVFPGKITQGPAPAPSAHERRVKEEQWRQLQALAHEIAVELGKESGDDELREVYRRFNRHFDLTTYKKLPRWRFSEGVAFFTQWREEIAANVKSVKDAPAGPDLSMINDTRLLRPEEPTLISIGDMIRIAPYELLLQAATTNVTTDRRIHEKTGIELIRIPAGPFLYGEDKRQIDLPEYWIGRYPLTNAQYKRFVDATGYNAPRHWNGGNPLADKLDHPVVYISWHDAQAYCNWAGLALPTEEEWEKAARGSDGRIYPWGDDPPTAEHGNFNRTVGETTSVGRYSPWGDSPYGCVDMAGNVWEWTLSRDEARRVLCGGSWFSGQDLARGADRILNLPGSRLVSVGCRLVRRRPSQAL